jgi:diguanylate cyclase (GGDEF)-like protein
VLRAIPPEEGLSAASLLDRRGARLAAVHGDPEPWPVSAFAAPIRERVSRDVVVDGERVGSLVLEYGGGPLARRLTVLLTALIGSVVLIVVAVLLIARRLAGHITAPLTHLQEVIECARAHEDLSRRAPPCAIIEIDQLRSEFHGLLDEVRSREADVNRTHGVLKRLATSDRLTGLANRAVLEARLLSLATSEQAAGVIGLLYFDLDSFKAVNDSLGHPVGDALLKAVAVRLKDVLPAEALTARIGGDEFVVLLAGLTSEAALETHAVTVQGQLEAPLHVGDLLFHPAVSLGWTAATAEALEQGRLLELADQAMYAAKNARRGAGRRTQWTRIVQQGRLTPTPASPESLGKSDQLVLARLVHEATGL